MSREFEPWLTGVAGTELLKSAPEAVDLDRSQLGSGVFQFLPVRQSLGVKR